MKLSPHHLKRYKDLTLLLLKYGQTNTDSKFRQGNLTNGHEVRDADELPKDLERLGPTFVKLGQLLSSRPDIVPEQYLTPLSRLQDRVKPFPFQDVEVIIEAELRAPINKIFCVFEREP